MDVVKAIDRAHELGFPASWIDNCLRARGLVHLLAVCGLVEAGLAVREVLGMPGHQSKE